MKHKHIVWTYRESGFDGTLFNFDFKFCKGLILGYELYNGRKK
jgi:hypothetical protein